MSAEYTFEDWKKNSTRLLRRADRFNLWQERARFFLLSTLGPRIGRLGRTGYYGCGFHYDMKQRFGKLVGKLSLPVQFSANHLDKVRESDAWIIMASVVVEALARSVAQAEESQRPGWKPSRPNQKRRDRKLRRLTRNSLRETPCP